ncbi:MAG: MFS transporter [bacterium]|nr:MFS transporter [bacterium]
MKKSPLPSSVRSLGLVSLFNDAASEMIYPLLPAFLTGVLGVGAVALGALEGVAESLSSILKLLSGRWSDKFHKRKAPTLAGYALSGFARPFMALTGAFWQLFSLRLLDRVGKGIRSAPRDALIADVTPPEMRGRAFGFTRALDHLGAVVGPLLAAGILLLAPGHLRLVFGLAAIPVCGALLILIFGVKDKPGSAKPAQVVKTPLNPTFWRYLFCVFLFTLGNSSDAFLLLRAQSLGVSLAAIPILWAAFHVVKSVTSTPGGRLSDRWGRKKTILTGWIWYALVYAGFAFAADALHVWGLFLAYGIFFGLTEGVERAYVADLVGEEKRGYAFGWYHLAIGIGALPASLIFGAIYQSFGAHAAFLMGAALALTAGIGLAMVKNSEKIEKA